MGTYGVGERSVRVLQFAPRYIHYDFQTVIRIKVSYLIHPWKAKHCRLVFITDAEQEIKHACVPQNGRKTKCVKFLPGCNEFPELESIGIG